MFFCRDISIIGDSAYPAEGCTLNNRLHLQSCRSFYANIQISIDSLVLPLDMLNPMRWKYGQEDQTLSNLPFPLSFHPISRNVAHLEELYERILNRDAQHSKST
jgi:hypothetical protein